MLILLFSSFAFISGKEISNFETLRNKLVYAQVGFQFDKHRDDSCDGTESVSEYVSAPFGLKSQIKRTMLFNATEFNRLLVVGMENGESVLVEFTNCIKNSFLAQMTNQSKKPVFLRYSMNAKAWNTDVHPVPFDIPNFYQGIENYSSGMVLITESGFKIDA